MRINDMEISYGWSWRCGKTDLLGLRSMRHGTVGDWAQCKPLSSSFRAQVSRKQVQFCVSAVSHKIKNYCYLAIMSAIQQVS